MLKRLVLLFLVAAGIAIGTGPDPHAQSCGSNAVVCENNLPGNPSSEWDITGAGDASIQGFATDISVNRGGTVHFKINTTAATFRIDVYRLGYYAGLGARKVATIPTVSGQSQPACLTNNTTFLVDCGNWSETASWAVPATAVSGIYVAKSVRSDTGGSSHIVFIVRDDASTSDVLFQTSDTTWQAYNQYGGFSLYLGSPQRAFKVSYNRPFSTRGQTGGFGPSDWLFSTEYPMLRWLEANGYDVTYFTGIDTARSGALIRNHRALLSVGHDEYWSAEQRASVEAARAAGVHLAFFSGNEIFWKTRWETSIDGSGTPFRTLVCYKETIAGSAIDSADPPTWTGTWRDLRLSPPADGGKPENALSGQLFTINRGSAAITVPSTYASLRFWRNTAVAQLQPGQTATLADQTLGYEWDEDIDNGFRPAGSMQLSSTSVPITDNHLVDFGNTYHSATVTHHMTLYRHASGALVFGAGTVQWAWGLDPNHDIGPDTGSSTADPIVQQATMNLLGDMGVQPQTRQAGLFPALPSSDSTAPTSAIASPAAGAVIAAGTRVAITGTAADGGGGVVGGVEASVDGGATWHPASGTSNWSYSWRPNATGTANILSRAVDDTGNLEQPVTQTTVTVGPVNCPCSIWDDAFGPWDIDSADANAIEEGVKFRSDVNGQITGIRFYKAPANTGTHTGHLWASDGTLLGSLTFSNETASGWQQASFATPISIVANTTYVASYHTNAGHYSVDDFYFGRSGTDMGPLHALRSGVDGPNGVFIYGATAFPTQSFESENTWVDVVLGPVDTTPPTVSITAPAGGVTVNGTVAVSATAADNVSVVGVQFKLDGANLGAEDTAAPYTINWNSTTIGNGSHTLTAVVRDPSANTTTSAPVPVTVNNPDVTPPTVSMTAPVNNAIVSGTGVTVSANASDNNGVAGVQFLLDGAALGAEVLTSPFTMSWNSMTTANGAHTLAARARDAAGNVATSANVTVTIGNGAPTLDVNVFTDKSTTTTTITSPTFSTNGASELLVAFVGADDRTAGNTVSGVTGGGLTWTLVRRTNTQRGDSEIWRAFSASTLSGASVTATLTQGAAASLTVVSFAGVDTTGTNGSGAVGATGSGSAATGAPTASLVSTRANSFVFGVGLDWDAGPARTLGANQTMVHQYAATNVITAWVQRTTSPVAASGTTVTINDTAPTADRYNLTICEILPPGTPTWTVSGAVTPAASGVGTTLALSGAATGTVTADAAGNFTFTGLANGTYTVTPSKTGFTFSPASQSVTVSGANVTAVNFTAAPVPTWNISGTVSPSASGANTTLTLSGAGTGTATADASGNFTFTGRPNGTYTVTPSKSGFSFSPTSQTVVVNGANVGAVNFTAAALPTWSVSGTVSPSANGSATTLTLSGAGSGTTTADASGNFTFTGLNNGTYTVTPSKSGFVFTPASQSVTASGANVTGVNFTIATAPPPSGIKIDANVSRDQPTSATTVASPAFSTTSANELVLAFVVADYLSGANTTVTNVTGAGLTWQLVVRSNIQSGTSEVWRAFAPSTLTNVTVTATLSQSVDSMLTVMSFSGVDTSGTNGSGAIGAIATSNSISGAPSASLATTRNNSWVMGAGNDYDNAIARIVGANQTLVHQYMPPVGDTYWVQRQNAPTPLAGTNVTINDTAPTSDRFNLAICEILPVPGT